MHRRLILSTSLLAAWPFSLRAAEPPVLALAGQLPLLVTVPHDGAAALAGVPPRTQGTTVRDLGTRPLADALAARIEARTGRRPYFVATTVSRQSIDMNRSEAEALESEAAVPVYREYHARIAGFVAELRERYPGGALLLDIHGQGAEPAVVFRGTRNGQTASAELATGSGGLFGRLAAKGWGVHPALDAMSQREDPRFNGGFTVATYGRMRADGVDAIQLEFGRQLRESARLPDELAEVVVALLRERKMLVD